MFIGSVTRYMPLGEGEGRGGEGVPPGIHVRVLPHSPQPSVSVAGVEGCETVGKVPLSHILQGEGRGGEGSGGRGEWGSGGRGGWGSEGRGEWRREWGSGGREEWGNGGRGEWGRGVVEKGAYLGELACQHGPLAVGAVPGTHQLRGGHTDAPGRSCDSHVTHSADDH